MSDADTVKATDKATGKATVKDRLIRCFELVFHDLSRAEITRASMASVGKWDSIATLNLLGVLEEEFAMEFDEEEFGELVSFELFLDFLEGRAE